MSKNILTIVRMIPAGKVMSYGQIAVYMGAPKEAREIGWAMRELGSTPNFPWWRVLNNAGELSISGNPDANAIMQKALLEKEGVVFDEALKLNIDTYRFRLTKAELQQFGLDDDYIETAIKKFEEPRQTSLFEL